MQASSLAAAATVLVVAALLADRAAHRDELAARRFRELNPSTVLSDLDKSRNKRWHRVGLEQRLVAVTMWAALVGLYFHSWLVFAAATWLGGWTTALTFDLAFNIRLKLPLFYLGSTALLDAQAVARNPFSAGQRRAAGEAAGVLVGLIAWLLFL